MAIAKQPTGIAGFDTLAEGGVPAGETTLVMGTPGSGKTVFALQTAANVVRNGGRAVIVTFEEGPASLLHNADGFSWNPADLADAGLTLIDGRSAAHGVASGDFDLNGLVAMLDSLCASDKIEVVVFDGIDQILDLLPTVARRQEEMMRLVDWLSGRRTTCLMTGKGNALDDLADHPYSFLVYALGCVVQFRRDTHDRLAQRTVEILKYRGSTFRAGALPFLIDRDGLEVAPGTGELNRVDLPDERISSGVERLDQLMGGGYLRGSATLVSGAPGTAKTTLAAAFAAATAARGETALVVALDERFEQIVRNARSVGIDLATGHASGHVVALNMVGRERAVAEQYVRIDRTITAVEPAVLVLDPMSALGKNDDDAEAFAERIMQMAKARGITCLATSLIDHRDAVQEQTRSSVSTIADTWISLSYHVSRGERNRALSIVKARGTQHSSQVRELILGGETGITLADVYQEGEEVLMGTARLAREDQLATEEAEAREAYDIRRRRLEAEAAAARARIQEMQASLERAEAEIQSVERDEEHRRQRRASQHYRVRSSREAHSDDNAV